LVRRIDAGALGAGEQTLPWDGKDSKGDVLPDGEYTFAVVATNAASQSVNATTYIKGTVTGVVYKEDTAYLSVGTREIPLGKVVEVSGNDVKAF